MMKSFSNLVWGTAWMFCLGGAFGLGACSTRQEPPHTLTGRIGSGNSAAVGNSNQVEAPTGGTSPAPELVAPSPLPSSDLAPAASPSPLTSVQDFTIVSKRPTPGESPTSAIQPDLRAEVRAETNETPHPIEPTDIAAAARADMEKAAKNGSAPVSEPQAYFGGLASTEGTPLYSDSEAQAKAGELENAGVEFSQFKQMHSYLLSIQESDDQNPQTRFIFKDRAAVEKAAELSKQGYNLDNLRRTTEFFAALVDPQTNAHVMPAMGALESSLNLVRAPNYSPDWLITRYNEHLPTASGPKEALDQVFAEVSR